MGVSFALASVIQMWIDGGEQPNIGWQIIVIALLTAAEVMVSIVALEFAYTQAPKTMKSFMMCLYLASVSVGNLFVAGVNHFIQIPSAATEQWDGLSKTLDEDVIAALNSTSLAGYDGKPNTEDDFIITFNEKGGGVKDLEIPGKETFEVAITRLEQIVEEDGGVLPDAAMRKKMIHSMKVWREPSSRTTCAEL